MTELSLPRSNHAHRSSGEAFRNSSGPIDPAGHVYDLSDRPILCASSNMRNEVVIGGSDHALYAIDVLDPRKKPATMYTKTTGHTDWVTTVAHLPSGQVLSGAMDGKLCLWSVTHRQSCIELMRDSTHPISKIITDVRYNTALALSYDGNIEVYSFTGEESIPLASSTIASRRSTGAKLSYGSQQGAVMGSRISPSAILTTAHNGQPVLEASYAHNYLATGDKSGALVIWDIQENKAVQRYRAHPGSITNVHVCSSQGSSDNGNLVITTGTDGYVKIWDPRSSTGSGLVQKIPSHMSSQNPAPVQPQRSSSLASSSSSAVAGRAGSGSGRGASSGGAGRGRGSQQQQQQLTNSSQESKQATVQGAPISVFGVTYNRGSNSDLTYLIAGGGSASDSRLTIMDARRMENSSGSGSSSNSSGAAAILAQYDHHRNGIYSLCVVDHDVLLTGDGVGSMLCHHLQEELLPNPRDVLKYGVGASSAGAVRAIHCLSGKVVTVGEDGKVIVFDY